MELELYYAKDEVDALLKLYPYAKIKTKELRIKGVAESTTYFFYVEIVNQVEEWLSTLEADEKELVQLRYFDKLGYSEIADYLRYKNHSSVIRKKEEIIKKIARIPKKL